MHKSRPVGSGLKQPVALIVVKGSIERHCSDIENSLRETLHWVNKQLESHEKIDYLFICQETWAIENDLLTPTLKIKRNVIEKKYAECVGKELIGDIIWQ